MPNDPIPLRHSLAQFCDKQVWLEYLSCFGDERAALEALHPSGRGALDIAAREMANNQPGDAKRAQTVRSFGLGDQLVRQLMHALTTGELTIEGFHTQSSRIALIPKKLCDRLLLDFANSSAALADSRYELVTVQRAGESQDPDITALCAQWMMERRAAHGDQLRKVLAALARKQFGDEFNNRAFGAAYTQVYKRKRGKPPKKVPG